MRWVERRNLYETRWGGDAIVRSACVVVRVYATQYAYRISYSSFDVWNVSQKELNPTHGASPVF